MSDLAAEVQKLLAGESRSALEQWLADQTERLERGEIPVDRLEVELSQGLLVYQRLQQFLREDAQIRARIRAIIDRNVHTLS